MQKSRSYHQYTDYDKEPGGLRKLDFIVETLERNFQSRPKSEIKILDVGCGNGNISLPLASLGYQVLGIDIDVATVEDLKRKNRFSNADFKVINADKICGLGKFDCIIASEFFEHLRTPQEFAKLVHQVLNPDGILIISIPNGTSLLENCRWFLNRTRIGRVLKKILRKTILHREKIQTQADSPHLQFFTLGKFKKILRNADFKILEIKNSSAVFGESFYLFWRFFLKRGSKIFNWMDNCDNRLADMVPRWLGVGWIIISRKLKIKS